MGEYGNINRAFAGMPSEHYQFNEQKRTRRAADIIDFGKPVFGYLGDEDNGYDYYLDTATLEFDADFVTSNTIDITVNAVAITQVTFTTDHDTTAGLVRDAIKAITITDNNGNNINPDCILDPGDANNRTFLIRGVGVDVAVTEDVQAGASQATGTISYSSDQVHIGLARHYAKETQTKTAGVNDTRYEINDAMTVVEEGFYVADINNVTILADNDAYIDNVGGDKGNFSNAGDAIDAKYRSNNFANSDLSQFLAVIELNGIKKLNAVIAWS